MRKITYKKMLPKHSDNEHTHISVNKRFKINDIIHEYIKEQYLQTVKCVLVIKQRISQIDIELLKKDCNRTNRKDCYKWYAYLIKRRYPKMSMKIAFDELYSLEFAIHCFQKIASFKSIPQFLAPTEVMING